MFNPGMSEVYAPFIGLLSAAAGTLLSAAAGRGTSSLPLHDPVEQIVKKIKLNKSTAIEHPRETLFCISDLALQINGFRAPDQL